MAAQNFTLIVNKSKYVIFGSRYNLRQRIDYNLKFQGIKLDRVEHMKYFDVTLDAHLTFNDHVHITYGKMVNGVGSVGKAREFSGRKTNSSRI